MNIAIMFSVLFILGYFLGLSFSARILCFYPVPFHSHQIVFQVFTEELSKRGHELVVIAEGDHRVGTNITHIDTNKILEVIKLKNDPPNLKPFYERNKRVDTITSVFFILRVMTKFTHAIIRSSEVQALINKQKEKFDLILIEECIPANLIIAAGFDAPVIFISSYFGNYIGIQLTGSESNPIYHADYNYGKILWSSSIWEKFTALIYSFKLKKVHKYFEETDNEFSKKVLGANVPTIRNLKTNVQVTFLNTYHFWDFSRPVPPSVIYTGGMHLRNPKPLPDDLKSYLDSAPHGVVYMSFGSKFKPSDLPEETRQIIIKVLNSIPYKVIWKIDGKLSGEYKNIKTETWFPQNDVLHHPSIKVFITHAGLQSTDEAIAAGVPLIALPITADQFTNANNYVLHGIGMKLNINTITENEFRDAIVEVAENERYRRNIKRLESIMKQHRDISLNKTMHYIDYVLKHGNTNLHSPAANLFEEYYQFDVIVFVMLLLVVVFIVIIVLLKILFCIMKQLFELR